MQEKFPLSSANLASRLAFLREKQRLTLQQLADGRPSTAQSWLDGKQPRRDRWEGIASRLGLSEMMVFFGRPETKDDYAFVAKWRNEIEDSERLLNTSPNYYVGEDTQSLELNEAPASYGSSSPSLILKAIEAHYRNLIIAAGTDAARLGWIQEQQRAHLAIPAHWKKSGLSQEEEEAAHQAEIDDERSQLPKIIPPPGVEDAGGDQHAATH